jgi:hypothetical protein
MKMTNRDERMKRVFAKAAEIDARRQEQIERQKKIINRLLEENQVMLGFISGCRDNPMVDTATRSGCAAVLRKVDKIREEAREEEKT